MDDELMSMSKKMDDLQTKYNFMQENSAKEIKRLHERLHLFHEHSPKRGELLNSMILYFVHTVVFQRALLFLTTCQIAPKLKC